MSVLETFYILFETDADQVKKGADEAYKATDNLENKLKQTDHVSQKLGEGFRGMALAAAGTIAALFSVGALIGSIRESVDFADQLEDQKNLLGKSTEELSAWGDAVAISGGTAQGFTATLSNLSASLAQLDATGKSRVAPFFEELGISMLDGNGKARDTLDLLLDIADKFQTMDKEATVGFGRKLGLDTGTILLLQQGRRGVEDIIRRQKELGVITTEQSEISNEYNDQLENMHHIMRTIGLSVASVVLPPLTEFLKAIQELFIYVKNSKGLQAFSTDVQVVGRIIRDILSPVISLTKSLWGLIAPFDPLHKLFMMMGGWLIYVADDILHFLGGYNSFIGTILDSNPTIKKAIEGIIEVFKDLFDLLMKIVNPFEFITSGKLSNFLLHGKTTIEQAQSSPLAAQTSGSIMSGGSMVKSNNVSIGEVNIQTQATDADGIAQVFGSTLDRQTRQTLSNFDDGIAK